MNAADIGCLDFKSKAGVGAIVSGLPLLSMPAATVSSILEGSFELLRQGATFFQFTYACGGPVDEQMLVSLELQSNLVGSTWRNLPPASVYGIRRISVRASDGDHNRPSRTSRRPS